MSDSAIITPEPSTASRWEVVPRGFFSLHRDLLLNGELVATLKMKMMREGCEFQIGGHDFTIRRKSMWKDGFQLAAGEQTVCEVRRTFWSQRFEIAVAGEHWQFRPRRWFSRTRELMAGERQLGTIKPAGFVSRRYVAEFQDEVPPPIQVLAIFLVLITERRASQSAGS